MVTVALAGTSSGFGLTMLRVFQQLNAQKHEHKIIVLSRSPRLSPDTKVKDMEPAPAVEYRVVDYNNHAQLVHALRNVHTLISCIGGAPSILLNTQLALLTAAKEAGVRRWAPSEYAGNGYDGIDLYAGKAQVWAATEASGLGYTRFDCGLFMSILATGTPKPRTEVGETEGAKTGEEEALAGLRPWNYVINARAGTADLAEDGGASMVVTEMRDVAQFVWRALRLEKWPKVLGMRGDVVSFRDLVALLEEVQGRKFLKKETSLEALEREAKEMEGRRFYNQTRIAVQKGWGVVGDDLNRAFPDFRPVSCKEFVSKWWSAVKLEEPAWETDVSFGAADM